MVDKELADKNPAGKKPPIFETAVAGWRDAFWAIELMPGVAGIAFALYLVVSLAVFAITNPFALIYSPWLPLFTIGGSIVQAVLFAPLAIAVHRFVLLGETTSRYPLEPNSSRYLHFVGFAILVKILWVIPNMIQSFPGTQDNPNLKDGLGIVAVVLTITVIIVVVRRAILFPAIAIDAPGATWSNARRDTKGSSWRVAFIFVLTALPSLAIHFLIYGLWLTMQTTSTTVGFLIFSVIGAVVAVPTLCAFAAAASHIYRARANILAEPRELPGSATA